MLTQIIFCSLERGFLRIAADAGVVHFEIENPGNALKALPGSSYDFVNLIKVIGDRVYALQVTDRAIYYLEGNLLEAPENWGPVPRWKEMSDDWRSPILLDLDPSGNYLLYIETGKADYEGNPVVPGFFIRDLRTGGAIRLSDYVFRRDRISAYGYKFLKDGTFLVRIKDLICRVDPADAKVLETYRMPTNSYCRLYVRLSPGEERLLVLKEMIDNSNSEWYGFELSGRQFFHEKTDLNFTWLPGGRVACGNGRKGFEIRDILENRVVYKAKQQSTTSIGVFTPHGCG